MKKRKLIGVIISEAEGLYQHKLLKGIISECYSLDYDVAVFSTLIKNTGLPEYKIGEKNIFNLINFDLLDGVIVAGITLAMENLPEEIEYLLMEKGKCPVLYIDKSTIHYPCIYTNDRKSMERITDHLIDIHGYRDIFCLAGEANNISTINRVEGYKDSLEKHKIVIDESRISYEGDFYYPGGEKLARKIINGEIAVPEAIVCISDHMAIGVVDELAKHGLHVPEYLAVTGYDATEESATCSTMITSYAPPVMQTGAEAVCELTRLMTGKLTEPCNIIPDYLEVGNSCGCNDVDYMKQSGIVRLKEKVDDYKVLLDSYMTEALTVETSFEDCITKFCYYLYLVKDYSDYYLCLCENWDGSENNYSTEKEIDRKVGYTEKMTMVLACENTKFVNGDITFDTKDMLPDLLKERKTPKAYYFTPVHFNEECIGYAVLTYGDKIEAFDITYRNWSRKIMNALEFNRAHRKLYSSSFRDVLTGIYNRNGFLQNLPTTVDEAISQHQKLFVIMADLDNLKLINDGYGHKEGDNVITVIANAFQSCCRGNDICARIGGDEFLVVGLEDDEYDFAGSFMLSMQQYIDKYNRSSKKPYDIQLSMGVISDYINDINKIKEMTDKADKIMYANKAINKKNGNS